MTDAERLTAGYGQSVCEAPFRIAPERADELAQTVFGGTTCDLHFEVGPANFVAHVGSFKIEARYAALLSLWATARACLQLASEVSAAGTKGFDRLKIEPGSAAEEAFALLRAAKLLIHDHKASWPADLPTPEPTPAERTHAWFVNNLFLGATAWALLHEVGHITLGHQIVSNSEREFQEEFEADAWAAAWMLEKPVSPKQQEFRLFCVAVGLAWLRLVEEVRGTDATHPPAFERLTKCSWQFPYNEDSAALQMAADVLKVVFDPRSTLSADHAADAFASIAIRLSRGEDTR